MRVRGGEVLDSFYSLVNPRMRIPPVVRRMTGINNAMLKDAPHIEEVMPKFLKFMGDGVLVSHNTIGDLKFLSHFAKQVCKVELQNFFLCTHLLSEKIFAKSSDKSLTGLGKYLKLEQTGQVHRAEADAKLTLELQKRLISGLQDIGIETVEAAVRYQGDSGSGLRLGIAIPREVFAKLPNRPGVFKLLGRDGEILFVSSVKNLRRDVDSLRRLSAQPKRILRLLLAASSLEFKACDNLLDAMLDEADLIAESGVSYPAQKWHLRCLTTVYFKTEGSGETLLTTGLPTTPTGELYGPVRDRKQIELHFEELAKLAGFARSRRGVVVPNEMLPVIRAWLQGRLSELLRRNVLRLLRPFSRVKKKTIIRQSLLAMKLRSMGVNLGLSGFQHTRGLLSARTRGGERVYPIVTGGTLYESGVSCKSWRDWARSKKGIELSRERMLDGDLRIEDQPVDLTMKQLYRLLALHWFVHLGGSSEKRSYRFYSAKQVQEVSALDKNQEV